jgi:hypothetical protein
MVVLGSNHREWDIDITNINKPYFLSDVDFENLGFNFLRRMER